MNRMCPGAAWLLVGCLSLSVGSLSGKVLPPRNLSLTWVDAFQPRLSWAPPQHSMRGCDYVVAVNTREELTALHNWSTTQVMNGGQLLLLVLTECNGTRSEAAVARVSYPELVKNLSCYIFARERSYCSWVPASSGSRLRFYYRLAREGPINEFPVTIHECPSYSYHDDGRHGCEFQAGRHHRVFIKFNETRNNSAAFNTFEWLLLKDVRAPPLNWTVQKTQDKFTITWRPPDIFDDSVSDEWTYYINYTQCGKAMTVHTSGTSYQLNRLPHCSCRMKIRAEINEGGTPWSEEKHFAADSNPNASVYAAIFIPLLFAGLAALTVGCCRKNRKTIFPKVPQPRDLLSDIADNNNKSNVCHLLAPAMEEENCKITLVVDPQVNKPTAHTAATTFI